MALQLSLQTRVGRRIVLLFFASALLPVAVLAVVGYRQVRRQLVAQAREQMARAAKDVGMGVLEQLGSARAALVEADAALSTSGRRALERSTMLGTRLRTVFSSLVEQRRTGAEAIWGMTPRDPTLDRRRTAALETGRAVIDLSSDAPPTAWIVVSRPGGRRLWGEVALGHLLFGAVERSLVGPGETTLCISVASSGLELYCPGHGDADRRNMVESWELFLAYDFSTDPWRVQVAQPLAAVLAPVGGFRRTFLATVVGVLGLVVLLSTIQVRRSLRPLAELQRGTERLARRDFSGVVHVESKDEFEVLAASFNAMATELAGRLEELSELSYGALAALARTIDASSPWTAGHSERVSALGLRMAERLGLDDASIDSLRRGGLLHDIGKIGISHHILDKPEALEPHELHRIRQHPSLGAKILSPIAAFADAIPVVRSHHERWDGTGYPDALAGEAIPYLARLLAVADVYDAMVSDRPYRPGWPREHAIGLIEQSAGSHFDPAMVEVFMAIMAEEGEAVRSRPAIASAAEAAPATEALG